MDEDVIATLVVASLKPQVGPVRVSLLGIFFAPAKWIGSKLHGGVYVPGDLKLTAQRLVFEPDRIRARLHRDVLAWQLPLADIDAVELIPGMIMKTLRIRSNSGEQTMKCLTGAEAFVQALEAARAAPTQPASS